MTKENPRTSRIEARLTKDALAIVKRAAEMEGRTLSDFIVAAAQEVARRTIEDHQVIRLSAEDQARFVDMLLDPPEPTDALRRARQAHEALILKAQ